MTTMEAKPDHANATAAPIDVREVQRSVKEKYTKEPGTSRATLRAAAGSSPVTTSPFVCEVTMRHTKLESSAHEGIGIVHDTPCSAEMLLGALAACSQSSVQIIANAMKVPIRKVEVYAEGDLDFRGTLGISREVPVGFTALRVRFELDAPDATPEQLKSLREKVARYCIIDHTLQKPPSISSEWLLGSDFPTLHQFVFSSSCEKVRRALHHKGVKWRTVETDWFNRKDIEALSGQRLTPVLVHGGNVCGPDSMAVIDYLEKAFEGPSLFPDDSREFCHKINDYVESIIFPLAQRAFLPAAARALYMKGESFERDVVRLTGASSAQLTEELPKTLASWKPHLEYFDQLLGHKKFLTGEMVSAADHALYSNLWFATNNAQFRTLVDALGLPNLTPWEERMKADYFTSIPF